MLPITPGRTLLVRAQRRLASEFYALCLRVGTAARGSNGSTAAHRTNLSGWLRSIRPLQIARVRPSKSMLECSPTTPQHYPEKSGSGLIEPIVGVV
jgi:hypothetical protein